MDGAYFSLRYPSNWTVETNEKSMENYLDTTVRSRKNPSVMIRVDVSPSAGVPDPMDSAQEVEHYLASQPEYRRIELRRIVFHGYNAVRWDFLVRQDGTLLRKVDVFFSDDAGDGGAILTQAPARDFNLWWPLFVRVRSSLEMRDAAPTVAAPPPSAAPSAEGAQCDSNYSGCLDPSASDYDCEGGSGNGPYYTGPVEVLGYDEYGLDADGNGYACEE